jgi:hypothetical protein
MMTIAVASAAADAAAKAAHDQDRHFSADRPVRIVTIFDAGLA